MYRSYNNDDPTPTPTEHSENNSVSDSSTQQSTIDLNLTPKTISSNSKKRGLVSYEDEEESQEKPKKKLKSSSKNEKLKSKDSNKASDHNNNEQNDPFKIPTQQPKRPKTKRLKEIEELERLEEEKLRYENKILEEEEYSEAMEKIIERDYFPDLPKMKLQLDYYNAIKNKDHFTANEILKEWKRMHSKKRPKLTQSSTSNPLANTTPSVVNQQTPLMTPIAGFIDMSKAKNSGNIHDPTHPDGWTPMSHKHLDDELQSINQNVEIESVTGKDVAASSNVDLSKEEKFKQKLEKDVSKMSLDQFVQYYQNEDNHSFGQIIDKQIEEYRKKYWWKYQTQNPATKLLEGPSSGNILMIEGPKAGEQAQITDEEGHKQKDIAYWPQSKYGNVTSHTSSKGYLITDGTTNSLARLSETASEKVILKANTRFPKQIQVINQTTSQPPTPSINPSDETSSTQIDETQLVNQLTATSTNNQQGGYSYMMTPSPMPGTRETDMESPFITWGEIASTPLLLDPSATPSIHNSMLENGGISVPQFRLPAESEKEKRAMTLAAKAAKNLKKSKKSVISTPTRLQSPLTKPTTPLLERSKQSPAIQKLIQSTIQSGFLSSPSHSSQTSSSSSSSKSKDAKAKLLSKLGSTIDTQLLASYQSPLVRHTTPTHPSSKTKKAHTPALSVGSLTPSTSSSVNRESKNQTPAQGKSITDNLLRL